MTVATILQQKPKPGDSERVLPQIERIILYIDDLDRCPEKIVVQVLQAVHLLLAFPISIVVVGVDSRWLLHSLQQHSIAFRENKANGSQPAEENKHWRSTPLNYLEKIFQIPFTLRPMKKLGFEGLIDNPAKSQESPKTEEKPESGSLQPGETGQPGEEPSRGEQGPHTNPPQTPPAESTPPAKDIDQPSSTVAHFTKFSVKRMLIDFWERKVMKKKKPG